MSINVKDYGAVGNGTTDDTGAFTDAIDFLNTMYGGKGTVFAPAGTYLVDYVKVLEFMTLAGEGPGVTILKARNGSVGVVTNITPTSTAQIFRPCVRDLSIIGNATTDYGIRFQGVRLGQVTNVDVSNCSKMGAYALDLTGYDVGGGSYVQTSYCTVREFTFSDCDSGVKNSKASGDPSTGGASFNHYFTIYGARFKRYGLNLEAGEGAACYSCRVETPTDFTIGFRVLDAIATLIDCAADGVMFTSYVSFDPFVSGIISQINYAGTDLLAAPISYATSDAATVAAVVAAINANLTTPNYTATLSPGRNRDIHIYDADGAKLSQGANTIVLNLTGITATFSGPGGTGSGISTQPNVWGFPEGHKGSDGIGLYVGNASSCDVTNFGGNGTRDRFMFQDATALAKFSCDRNSYTYRGDLRVGDLKIEGSLILPTYTWTSKPVASVNSGKVIQISDVGIGGGSQWKSDGAYWHPLALVILASSGVAILNPANTTENILAQVKIPAGTMAASHKLDVDLLWSMTGNTNSKQMRARFGTITSTAFVNTTVTTATTVFQRLAGKVWNRGQRTLRYSLRRLFAGAVGPSTASPTVLSINTANSSDLFITGQLGVGTDTLTLEAYEVRLLP